MSTSTKISQYIAEICKLHNIKYCSINPDYHALSNDAKRLAEICNYLLINVDEIDEILQKHNIKFELSKKINKDLQLLHEIEHDLINLAQIIKCEKPKL